jgi:hypothetical protein
MDPVSRASVLLPLVAVLRCHVRMAHPVMQAIAFLHAKAFVQLEFAARIVRFLLQVRASLRTECPFVCCITSSTGTHCARHIDAALIALLLYLRHLQRHAAVTPSAIRLGAFPSVAAAECVRHK